MWSILMIILLAIWMIYVNHCAVTEKLKQELEKQYHEALSDLEEMRGTNEEMDALIEQEKVECFTSIMTTSTVC